MFGATGADVRRGEKVSKKRASGKANGRSNGKRH
jgi:hypothetical protein